VGTRRTHRPPQPVRPRTGGAVSRWRSTSTSTPTPTESSATWPRHEACTATTSSPSPPTATSTPNSRRTSTTCRRRHLDRSPLRRRADSSARRPAPEVATGTFDLTHAQDGSFVTSTDGDIAQLRGGATDHLPARVAKDRSELARLIGLRDAARPCSVSSSTAQRGRPAPRNRCSPTATTATDVRTGRSTGPVRPAPGAVTPRPARSCTAGSGPRMGGFREDPDWPLVAALEVFDGETQQARPPPSSPTDHRHPA
jgi:hypothetical protein